MLKNTIESVIEKYYLNGLVEAARLIVDKKNILIAFTPAEDKSLIGKVTCKNFDVDDCTMGIYNTTQLIKLIKILDHNISMKVHQERSIADKILLSDNKYDLEYYLAELNLIRPVPKVKEPSYDILINLMDDGFIAKFTNAKKALGEIRQFTFEKKGSETVFTLGEGVSYSNKVKFSVPILPEFNIPDIKPIPFSANLFNEVLLANKKCTSGTLQVSNEGLLKISFQEGDLESTYFLIRLEDI